jgi:hypothetical protein
VNRLLSLLLNLPLFDVLLILDRQIPSRGCPSSPPTYVTLILSLTYRISIRYVSDTGVRPIRYGCISDTLRGVSNYFIHFDQRIRTLICPDTSRYFPIRLGYALICLWYVSDKPWYVSDTLWYISDTPRYILNTI